MVRHIIIGIMSDDKVRIYLTDDIDYLVSGFFVIVIDVQIVKTAVEHFDITQTSGTLGFFSTHGSQFIGLDDLMAQIAAAQMTYYDTVATLFTL